MTQDELKAMVGQAALDHVVPGEIVGVGTGSTVNHFIDALGQVKERIVGAVSSSVASTQRLQASSAWYSVTALACSRRMQKPCCC